MSACPRCQSPHTVAGQLLGERGRALGFKPVSVRFWTFKPTMVALSAPPLLGPNATSCTACGLVWSEVDPTQLRDVLRAAGTEATRAHFGPALEEGTGAAG